jgi:hypothetical protein
MHLDRQSTQMMRCVRSRWRSDGESPVAHRGSRSASVIKMKDESTNRATSLLPPNGETTSLAAPERRRRRDAKSDEVADRVAQGAQGPPTTHFQRRGPLAPAKSGRGFVAPDSCRRRGIRRRGPCRCRRGRLPGCRCRGPGIIGRRCGGTIGKGRVGGCENTGKRNRAKDRADHVISPVQARSLGRT